ncbi:phage major capsid protein [Lacticaseibacillus daqingensis]|uniref:phage major capsid protein n=1 Tax=Lacticaseibacillus daqingensis TaxID=2486014 RepID=UPI000F79DE66|nr:phage major capsid protein [Lacticaseibacillus daqingensis]
MQNLDVRTYATTITRDTSDDGVMKISGYGAVFNQPAQADSFVEYMRPEALDGVDLSGVLLLYAHDSKNILARADSGNLSLKVDKQGLAFTATLPDTTLGHDTYSNIQAGNIKGCSIGFSITPGGDSWEQLDGKTTHIINKIDKVVEVSLTPIPAYTETSVTVQRDLEHFESEEHALAEPDKAEEPEKVAEAETPEPEKAPDEKVPETRDAEPEAPAEPKPDELQELRAEVSSLTAKMKALAKKADKEEAPEQRDIENIEDKGDNTMAKTITELDEKSVEQRDLEAFLKTGKVEHRDAEGFTSAEGEAVLPLEVLNVLKQPEDPAQLSGYANKVAVSAATGKLPVLKRATAQLATAEELAENPQIANASIEKVTYDVATYRGQLPISMEMAQDYGDITSLLAQYVQTVKNQTEQHKIGAVLAKATPVAAKSIDDIKDAYNTGLTNYGADRMFVISEALFAELDKAKDNDGRYLLQDSIASATGKSLLGAPVVIVPDDVLGKAGDKVGFVGSVKAFVLEAIRANVTLNWARNEQFEQILGVAFRADFKVADKDAGKFITYNATPSEA